MESMITKFKGVTAKAKRTRPDSATEPERKEEESKEGYLRSKAQEIVDVLAGKGSDPPTRNSKSAAKFAKVCEILSEVGNKLSERPTKEPERPSREEVPTKPPTAYQSQVIADLEAKYIDIKEERDSLRREKDSLAGRVEQLQREVKLLLVS